jgi:hypothetical protein
MKDRRLLDDFDERRRKLTELKWTTTFMIGKKVSIGERDD